MGYNKDENKILSIGKIGNYYGGLYIKKENNKFYWIIENHDTEFNNTDEWEEISENLYLSLIKEEINKL